MTYTFIIKVRAYASWDFIRKEYDLELIKEDYDLIVSKHTKDEINICNSTGTTLVKKFRVLRVNEILKTEYYFLKIISNSATSVARIKLKYGV